MSNHTPGSWYLRAAKQNARLITAKAELLEALKNVTAALVAAHSLLQDGGKKSVGSDRMFEIMLHDYEKSIEVGRAAIAEVEGGE
jgi:hypothetical protein